MQMLNFTNNCYLKEENKIHMTKNAIFWIREDFRIEHNPALSYASQNHDNVCLLYTSDAADDMQCVDLGGRRIIKKKRQHFSLLE